MSGSHRVQYPVPLLGNCRGLLDLASDDMPHNETVFTY